MKIVEINSCNFGSTGNIMIQIGNILSSNGHEVYYTVPKSRSNLKKQINNQIFIGNRLFNNLHIFLSKITGLNGCFSFIPTYIFLKKMKKINPDIIHLHNLHNSYINIPMLFNYIKKNKIKVVWTLHDCWPFTGHCPHFASIKCDRWKQRCYNCPLYKEYPKSIFDNSSFMYKIKKRLFLKVDNLLLVTPSKWLAQLVKNSFMKSYPVYIINNGIDLSIFYYNKSNYFKNNYNINKKYIILGVANPWSFKKGLFDFIELSKLIDDRFQIVLVGTSKEVEDILPKNIISIRATSSKEEMASIYSSSDIFVNPTHEDNFPTVNIEANACGLYVITYNTGGSSEMINNDTGTTIYEKSAESIYKEILNIYYSGYDKKKCIMNSTKYNNKEKFSEYLDLMNQVIKKNY